MASKAIHPHVTPPAATPANHPKNKGPKGDAVRYPQDHRHVVWIRPSLLVLVIVLALTSVATAWVQYLLFGLPQIPIFTQEQLKSQVAAHGFPAWLRITHYVNFLFLILLIRSGLSILVDHPRLYRSRDCTPGTEWARFTPLAVPKDRLWTAKDDARYLSPWLGLPGYRHTVGVAQHWHFPSDLFWTVNGLIYVVLLFVFSHWARLVPTSWHIFPQARATFVHYVTLHLPPEPDGFYRYNALQQLAYFVVVFVMAPLSLLTGLAMSPAIDNRFQWYARLFGGRQGARSFHFLLMAGFTAFIVVHVSLVVATGFTRNMNHIVWGVDPTGSSGLMLGAVGVAAVIGACVAAHWLSWNRPRALQVAAMRTVGALKLQTIDPLLPRAEYTKSDISPHFWPNGKMPTSEEWLGLGANGYKDYRLRVYGLVDNPVEPSLDELRAMGKQERTTLHHCIQGWSGIAEWGGLSMTKLVALVRPQTGAKVVVFHSFGEGLYGGEYYETHSMANVLHPQSLLAYEMNYETLSDVYGAPLRLRVENQLGCKMVKWITAIEFVASEKDVGAGFGGIKEDEEYFDLVADI